MKHTLCKTKFLSFVGAIGVATLAVGVAVAAGPVQPGPAVFSTPGPTVGDSLQETEQKALRAIRSKEGAPAGATGQVSAATPAALIAGRAGRHNITVRNVDPTYSVYVGFVAGVNAGTGMLLKPGESLLVDTTADMYVFAASGTPIVAWLETYTPPDAPNVVTVLPPTPE